MKENNHFISHRKFCIHSKENLYNNEKINSYSFLTNMRCSLCNHICLIKLDKENYNFDFECTHCSPDKISENDSIVNNYYKLRNKLNNIEYYNKSDFYCQKHTDYIFHSFCKKCNLNICELCLNRHYNHEKIELNSIIPEQNDVFISKIKIRKKKDIYEKILENIIKIKNEIDNEINSLIIMIKNIFYLEEYIIKNYNTNNLNKNYYYLENFKTIIKNLDINFSLSDEFINDSNFEERSRELIEAIIKFKKNYKGENNEINESKLLINNINNISYDNNTISKKNIKIGKSFNFTKINRKNNNASNSINNQKQKDKFKRSMNVLNISLDDTMQKNEQLEGYKKIGNEFVEFIKIPELENHENKCINKDNNRGSSLTNNNFNNNYDNLNNNNKEYQINSNEKENENFKEEYKEEKEQILPQIKFKKNFDNIIKSIEFLDKNRLLICESLFLNIYEINNNSNEIELIYSLKNEEEGNFNYATKLSDGNIIICSTYDISIIKLEKSHSKILNHNIIQKISNKGYNINKIIEIPNKQSIISCDKENIKKYKKDSNSIYNQINTAKIDSEIKCIEFINDDVFVAVMPKNDEIIFYDIDAIHNNKCIYGKIYTIHGRYVIKNSEKFNCVFFASTIGIYIFSNTNYKLISIYKMDDWISSLCLDYENDYLICSGINKNDINNKNISLIIFSLTKNEFEEIPKNKIKLLITKRIDNVCKEDITAINYLEKKILLGSNDKTLQLYNF